MLCHDCSSDGRRLRHRESIGGSTHLIAQQLSHGQAKKVRVSSEAVKRLPTYCMTGMEPLQGETQRISDVFEKIYLLSRISPWQAFYCLLPLHTMKINWNYCTMKIRVSLTTDIDRVDAVDQSTASFGQLDLLLLIIHRLDSTRLR
jgi:hypothetical protein